MAVITERVDKKGQKTYQVKIRIKGFPTQTATFHRKTDAKRWEQQTEAAIREHRFFPQDKTKTVILSELIDRYIENILPRKPKSYNDQRQQLYHWRDTIGHLRIIDISPALISQEREKLLNSTTIHGKKRSPATVNRYISVLRHLFTIAIKEWQLCRENPIANLTKLKESRGRTRFLSPDERNRLLRYCKQSDNQYLYIIVVLALSTGARKNEILSLTWGDIDLDRQTITIHETKNGEIRSIPLQAHGLDLVRSLASTTNKKPDEFLFKGKLPDKPIDIRSSWETCLKNADIEDFRFHDLRHTTASYLAMNGASLNEIATILGHKTLSMVMRYAHLSEAHTKKIVSDMNSKIFNNFEGDF